MFRAGQPDSKESTDVEGPTYKPEADVKEPVDESAGITEKEEAKGEFDTDAEETSIGANEPMVEQDRDAYRKEPTEESDMGAGEATGGVDSGAKGSIIEQDAKDDLIVPTEGREEDAEVPAEETFAEAKGPADPGMDMEEPPDRPRSDEAEPPKDAASEPDDGTDGERSPVEPEADEPEAE